MPVLAHGHAMLPRLTSSALHADSFTGKADTYPIYHLDGLARINVASETGQPITEEVRTSLDVLLKGPQDKMEGIHTSPVWASIPTLTISAIMAFMIDGHSFRNGAEAVFVNPPMSCLGRLSYDVE